MNHPRINYRIPAEYKPKDFSDFLTTLKEKTEMKVENGIIQLGGYFKQKEIRRFGKIFTISLLSFGGLITFIVKEKK